MRSSPHGIGSGVLGSSRFAISLESIAMENAGGNVATGAQECVDLYKEREGIRKMSSLERVADMRAAEMVGFECYRSLWIERRRDLISHLRSLAMLSFQVRRTRRRRNGRLTVE